MTPRPRPLEGPGSQHRLARLQRRFRAQGQRHSGRLTRALERLAPPLLVATATAFAFSLYLQATGFPPGAALKHLVAVRNCDTARALGLAEARPGEPGYWPRHDRDQDGIACEPWP